MATSKVPSALLIAATIYSAALSGPLLRDTVEQDCLTCICEASTGCNATVGCNGDLCGIYAITQPFWEDANAPTIPLDEPHLEGAFERCVNDPVCAMTTVQNYMERFARDCNEDTKINCHDYSRIHRFGPFDCEHELDAAFAIKFEPCMERLGDIELNKIPF